MQGNEYFRENIGQVAIKVKQVLNKVIWVENH